MWFLHGKAFFRNLITELNYIFSLPFKTQNTWKSTLVKHKFIPQTHLLKCNKQTTNTHPETVTAVKQICHTSLNLITIINISSNYTKKNKWLLHGININISKKNFIQTRYENKITVSVKPNKLFLHSSKYNHAYKFYSNFTQKCL